MTKLETVLLTIVALAVLGVVLLICKTFGVITISWELSVLPLVVSAISFCVTIFMSLYKYLTEEK